MNKYDELLALITKSDLSDDDKILANNLIDALIEDANDNGYFNGAYSYNY